MDTVEVEGLRLCYTQAGDGPPLLLIHGLGANRSDWDAHVPVLSRHFRVIAPDLPGYGDSDKPFRFYSVPFFARLMWQLCDRLGLERLAIVGHSMGGATALQMALDAPQRVERLVISNSVPSFKPRNVSEYREFIMRTTLMALLGPRLLAKIMSRRMFPRPEQADQRARVIARSRHNHRHTYLASLFALGRWSVLERLPEVQTPALVIAAEWDYFPLEDVERFAAELPNGQLRYFAGTRHGLPLEIPGPFNEVVLEFLSGRAARPVADGARV